jgi:hypothetical protein
VDSSKDAKYPRFGKTYSRKPPAPPVSDVQIDKASAKENNEDFDYTIVPLDSPEMVVDLEDAAEILGLQDDFEDEPYSDGEYSIPEWAHIEKM